MRRRILGMPAPLAMAAVVALVAATAATAGAPVNVHRLDGLHETGDFTLEAKPTQSGFVTFEVDSNETGDKGAWELVVRNHAGTVVYDGPCVSGTEDGKENVGGLVLASNLRLYGGRIHTFEINLCADGYHVTEVRIRGIRSYLIDLRFA